MRLTLLLLLLLFQVIACADILTGRVVRVTDGDTIVILDATNTQHKIQLQGIDSPERGQAFGTKSKEHLSDLVAGETVVVNYSKRDRYQRILGKVLLDDQDVNLEQIVAGMAWHYKKYQGEQTTDDRWPTLTPSWMPGGISADCGLTVTGCRPGSIGRQKRQQRKELGAFTDKSKAR